MTQEALKLALEALEHAAYCVQNNYCPDKMGHDWDDTIAAIHKALAQPEQKPVGQVGEDKHGLVGHIYDDRKVKIGDKLYTTPPQRTWVGLTDDDLLQIRESLQTVEGQSLLQSLTKAIEAKLREKNT